MCWVLPLMLVYFYDVNPRIMIKNISQYFICALLLPFRLYALLRNANSRRRRLTGHTAHFPHCSSLSNVTEIQKQKYKNTELLNAEYNVFLFS